MNLYLNIAKISLSLAITMKIFVILAATVCCTLAALSSEQVSIQWKNFKSTHKKSYASSIEEFRRLAVFSNNLKTIEEHNQRFQNGEVSYKLGVNQFADMTHDEFVKYVNKFKKPATKINTATFVPNLNADLPETVDWREQGAVSVIKDQKSCGSCWAFSTTGSLESANILKNNITVLLSEQELVDCSKNGDNAGCDGGFMNDAFEYVIQNGLSSEEDYPYEAKDNTCRRGSLPSQVTEVSYVKIKSKDESALKNAVATVGPISVAVDATYWQFYSGGVFTDNICGNFEEDLNHGVLAVGYGRSEYGRDYWLVKNSWGTTWGEKGFIKTARNANNNCGIATDSSYPTL